MHVTCRTPTCTVGLLTFPSPSTVDPITNPSPQREPVPVSITNSPPFLALRDISAMGAPVPFEVGSVSSNRSPSESDGRRSRHASSRAHGCHVVGHDWSGRMISQAPGFDRETRADPGEGTNGVTIEAVATGDPERSWIVTVHPFRWSDRGRVFGYFSARGLMLPCRRESSHELIFPFAERSGGGRDLNEISYLVRTKPIKTK